MTTSLFKKISLSLIAVCLTGAVTTANAQNSFTEPKKLALVWHVYENHYQGKDQTLSGMSIRNNSGQPLPATGWKIFFNFGKRTQLIPDQYNLEVKHINGGLYTLSPGKDFKGLAVGQEIEQKFTSNGWVVNTSDGPQGFYLVWDKEPGKGIALNEPGQAIPEGTLKMERYKGDQEVSQQQLFTLNERGRTATAESPARIFPKPLSYKETEGFFTLSPYAIIQADKRLQTEAELLSADLKPVLRSSLKISDTGSPAAITLKIDAGLQENEYKLSISAAGVLISGKGAAEVHYGIQSLKTLIDPQWYSFPLPKLGLRLKCMEVQDRPSFGFRGVMLDVARNFQPKQELLKLIDLLSLYKFTTLHLHLNDDEGWRLEVKALPELTDIGSKRGHTLDEQDRLMPSYGSGPAEGKNSGSGYYSHEDFVEILKYAAQRHIKVIPEIETPGHARAAIISMQARYTRFMKSGDSTRAREYLLRDLKDTSVYRSVQQWNDHVIDVSLPSAYHFLEVVSDELTGMYKEANAPLETIHFGGDEVPAGVWTGSPSVNAFKAVHPDVKEPADLWNYFFGRLSDMLSAKGLYLSGWEETALRKSGDKRKAWQPNPLFLNRNFHVNVWNNMAGNEDLAYRLANSGYKVILSFVTNFYFDMAYRRQFDEPGYNWGGFINVEQAFKFIPFDYLRNQHTDYINKPLPKSMLAAFEPLTAAGKQNIVGIQGLLWTETVRTPERLEYMYLPRLLALAERAWSPQADWAVTTDTAQAKLAYEKDWARFTTTLGREMIRLDHYAEGYRYRIPTPALRQKNGFIAANTDIPGFEIRYTTDGSDPVKQSKLYQKPVQGGARLRFRAFNSTGRGGKITSLGLGEKP